MKVRKTSRIVLLDARGRVLLFKIEYHRVFHPKAPVLKPYWITPGGEVEAGESHEAAARRELWEETGISGVELGAWIWTSEHELHWEGEMIRMHERFFLVRAPSSAITLDNFTAHERHVYRAHRWWRAEDIASSGEVFFPSGLGDLLAPIVAGQVPASPIAIH